VKILQQRNAAAQGKNAGFEKNIRAAVNGSWRIQLFVY
jgi:hypothetical protein